MSFLEDLNNINRESIRTLSEIKKDDFDNGNRFSWKGRILTISKSGKLELKTLSFFQNLMRTVFNLNKGLSKEDLDQYIQRNKTGLTLAGLAGNFNKKDYVLKALSPENIKDFNPYFEYIPLKAISSEPFLQPSFYEAVRKCNALGVNLIPVEIIDFENTVTEAKITPKMKNLCQRGSINQMHVPNGSRSSCTTIATLTAKKILDDPGVLIDGEFIDEQVRFGVRKHKDAEQLDFFQVFQEQEVSETVEHIDTVLAEGTSARARKRAFIAAFKNKEELLRVDPQGNACAILTKQPETILIHMKKVGEKIQYAVFDSHARSNADLGIKEGEESVAASYRTFESLDDVFTHINRIFPFMGGGWFDGWDVGDKIAYNSIDIHFLKSKPQQLDF